MKTKMNNLINKFNENQKIQLKELLATETDRFIIDYSTLIIAMNDNISTLSETQLMEFYNLDNIDNLNKIDVLIAQIVNSLTETLDFNVKEKYYEKFTLDPEQFELIYLIDLITKTYY